MSEFSFYIRIEDALTGAVLGDGPLSSVSFWEYTARFDRAGAIAFDFDASDPVAPYVTNTRIARAFALLGDTWTEVGVGEIDNVVRTPVAEGRVTCQATGLDLIGELGYRSVGKLEIGKPNGETHANALADIEAYAPDGWTFTPAGDPGNNYIYARYDGESVLGALIYLAEKTGTHFYRGTGKHLIFAGSFTSSGMRAVGAFGHIGAGQCLIGALSQQVDTHELKTRIYGYGSGSGEARLTLQASNRTAPSGYIFSKAQNYLESTSATGLYGLRETHKYEFKEITPISNTAANRRAAANMLFDSVLMTLRRISQLASQYSYEIELEGCNELLFPMQTIDVLYRDVEQGITIDATLNILEVTWRISANGAYTSRLVVSDEDRWPDSDATAAAERAVQGRVFQAHPQLGPNSYWENATIYVGHDQTNHVAEFPFVLGPEVAQVKHVRFRFKVTEVLSFTSVATATGTSSGSSSQTTSEGGSEHSHTVTIGGHTHTIPDHGHTLIVAGPGVTGAPPVRLDVSGSSGFLRYDGTGDKNVLTTPGGGNVATSNSGGSSTPTSSSESSHTHNIDHTHEVTPEIIVSYGVYRAPTSLTYEISDLEYAINGGLWIALDTAIPAGDYYEIDLTADLQDPDTFVPLQENNLIEIRRASGAAVFDIDSSTGSGTDVHVSTYPEESGVAVGDMVTISGSSYHDGVWQVIQVDNEWNFWVNMSGDSNSATDGTVSLNKNAMLYCKLGVFTEIQAVALL